MELLEKRPAQQEIGGIHHADTPTNSNNSILQRNSADVGTGATTDINQARAAQDTELPTTDALNHQTS